MAISEADLSHLAETLKRLRSETKRWLSLIKNRQDHLDCTPKQNQKRSNDITWAADAVNKLEIELHVAAVNCGLADRRSSEFYGERWFNPSPLHKYKWTPPHPRDTQP